MVQQTGLNGSRPNVGHSPDQRRRSWMRCRWACWLWPVWGLCSLVWFLVRVIPKPSRAAYPWQRGKRTGCTAPSRWPTLITHCK